MSHISLGEALGAGVGREDFAIDKIRYQKVIMACHKSPGTSEAYRLQRLQKDLGSVALEYLTPETISAYRDNCLHSVSGA